jgi:hypothetical protein
MAAIKQFSPQVGDDVAVGFDSYTQSGFIMQVVSGPNPTADVSEVIAQDGSTHCVLVADEKMTLELEAVLTSTGLTAVEALEIGSTVTVKTVAYRVTALSIDRGPKETRARLSLLKEDSITYT